MKSDYIAKLVPALALAAAVGLYAGTAGAETQHPNTIPAPAGDKLITPQSDLTGEMDVENEETGTFKIGDHERILTAPAGIDIEELDGEVVTVTIDQDGKVISIAPHKEAEHFGG